MAIGLSLRCASAVTLDGTEFFHSGSAANLTESSGVLQWVIPSSNQEIRAYLRSPGESFSLGVGQSFTLSMEIMFSTNLTTDTDTRNDTIRFGLLNSGSTPTTDLQQLKGDNLGTSADFSSYTGYGFRTSTSSLNSGGQFGERTGSSSSSTAVLTSSQWDLNGGSDPWSLPSTPTWLDVTMIAERTSATETEFRYLISDPGSPTTTFKTLTDTSGVFEFDSFVLARTGNSFASGETIQIRNFSYAIPEPATFSLVLVVGGALMLAKTPRRNR